MTSRDFCYWLQGYLEIASPEIIDVDQLEAIKKHLALVFIHEIDPSHSPKIEVQNALNEIHDPDKKFRC